MGSFQKIFTVTVTLLLIFLLGLIILKRVNMPEHCNHAMVVGREVSYEDDQGTSRVGVITKKWDEQGILTVDRKYRRHCKDLILVRK